VIPIPWRITFIYMVVFEGEPPNSDLRHRVSIFVSDRATYEQRPIHYI